MEMMDNCISTVKMALFIGKLSNLNHIMRENKEISRHASTTG